ncbi:NUDIX hydrolase [Williamsia sp.]|uniref:NUDIX hydrolase n=1 Tax=Williamsia sp. TaxID=1872085 RepID=UPI001A1EBE2C|nr:NUDIX hydrolase [Williamsia sp.]MBJ7291013.1 NUDIX hydrolase [Williamsia sp.]
MSAEPSEPKRDVAGRPRRRRGNRRGGKRRGGPGAGQPGTTAATAVGDAAPATLDTSDAQAPTTGPAPTEGSRTGSRRGRRGRRRKPSRPTADNPDAAASVANTDGGDSPVAVKPSDLNAINRTAGHGGRSARGAARATPTKNASVPKTNPRLRTVRETSAGGLIVSGIDGPDRERCAALIGRVDRRGRMMWSLPKGHIETGETAEQTAVREVAEETGIEGNVVASLGKIEYWFVSEGKRIHKTVHHYLMRSTGGELSDADYEVAEVAWVPLAELPQRLTYSDERRLARTAEEVIADLADDPERLARSEADSARTEPNEYEKAAAARNQRRNDAPKPARARRRRRGPRRGAGAPTEAADVAHPEHVESPRERTAHDGDE